MRKFIILAFIATALTTIVAGSAYFQSTPAMTTGLCVRATLPC
jgi:hypothetical protein